MLASFWMIGNLTVAASAWLIIPHDIGWNEPGAFKYNSWRIFVAVSAVPSMLVALALLALPESPKFLLSKGRERESLNVLRLMFSTNTGGEMSNISDCNKMSGS